MTKLLQNILHIVFYKFNLPQLNWTIKLVTNTSCQNQSLLILHPKIYNQLKDLSEEKIKLLYSSQSLAL